MTDVVMDEKGLLKPRQHVRDERTSPVKLRFTKGWTRAKECSVRMNLKAQEIWKHVKFDEMKHGDTLCVNRHVTGVNVYGEEHRAMKSGGLLWMHQQN